MPEIRNEKIDQQQDDASSTAPEVYEDLDVEVELEAAETSFSFSEPRLL